MEEDWGGSLSVLLYYDQSCSASNGPMSERKNNKQQDFTPKKHCIAREFCMVLLICKNVKFFALKSSGTQYIHVYLY